MLEEKKMTHQGALKKHTDDESAFEDNERKAFDLTLNRHCTKVMKNRIEELTHCEADIQNNPSEVSREIEKNTFAPNKSKCECVGIKETIKQSVVDTSQKDNESSLDCTK